ncbi:MAG: hypothetical protein RLP44_02445 [Aggregatilineales bacterium]
MSGTIDGVDGLILQIVKGKQRRVRHGVLPWMLQAHLEMEIHESTLRRRMRNLWLDGKLERVGGATARRGYKVAA